MRAFEIKINESDYPYLVVASDCIEAEKKLLKELSSSIYHDAEIIRVATLDYHGSNIIV